MRLARQVGAEIWLGLAGTQSVARPAVSMRCLVDRRASAEAERAVVSAARLVGVGYSVSRSHSMGLGAAAVSPAGLRVGVDLVWLPRVTRRHSTAILSPAEQEALRSEGTVRPALAWALKEAAAKAVGGPQLLFPHGLRIERSRQGIGVRVAGRWFDADWLRIGAALCAWVWEVAGGRDQAPDPPFATTSPRSALSLSSPPSSSLPTPP